MASLLGGYASMFVALGAVGLVAAVISMASTTPSARKEHT
jgi:hypothetical protein